jgi:hypothetical protein
MVQMNSFDSKGMWVTQGNLGDLRGCGDPKREICLYRLKKVSIMLDDSKYRDFW